MEIDFIDRKRKLYTWHPLWKNQLPKNLSITERDALHRIRKIVNVPDEFIETVLTINGEKALRAKTFIGMENGINRYEYHLFHPLVMENDQMCYKALEKTDSVHPDVVNSYRTLLVGERDLISKLQNIFNKKVLHGEAYDYKRSR